MQAYQSVRERKMNKAHREIINDENKNTLNEQKTQQTSIDKKKIIRENIAERKRKRISAQNEIIIPNLEEKYKIPTTPSQQIKKTNESEETTPTTLKPKKYYDQDEIRKYIKEKRISRRKSQEEIDQVVPEKPKTKSYDVNEVRDFMRKRLKAREEQHKKEILDKERKSNEIKERLQKLRDFQRNQRNSNNDKNKIKSKIQTDASTTVEKSKINIQNNNYLKPTKPNSNKVVVINKFSKPVDNDSNLSISKTHTSSNIYDNDINHTFSSLDNSEYENIPTKLTNDSYDELSEITNSITKDNDLESTSNYNEDYSIESLQSQAKRIQELIKNAEVLAQRIEQHTSKMPKPKENVNKLTININTSPIEKINSHPTISTDIISRRDNDSSSSSSSNYPISSPYPITSPYPSSSHSDIASTPYAFLLSHSNNETHISDQIPVHEMKNSKGKNELLSENSILSIENLKPSPEVSINKIMSPASQKSPSKNKLKEKEPYYEMENENPSYDHDQTPIHDESLEKSLSLNDISLSTDSEIKLESVENITPHQWRLQINSPAKKGDNYSTINIFTRRFHPSKKEDMKRKSDSNNIYKKIVKKMEEENKEEKLSLDNKINKESINATTTTTTTEQNNTMGGITEKQTYNESDHSSNPIGSESRFNYSDDFTNLSNYHSSDDSSSQNQSFSDYTSISNSDYSSQNIQPPTPLSTSYQQHHYHCPPPQPQIQPIPTMSAPTYENKEEGRLSPYSLSRKLMSEINYLETLNESNLRLAEMENERNTVRAEQEMATVLHALILKQKKHEMDIENAIKFREDKLRTIGIQALPETNEKGVLAEEEQIKKDDPKFKTMATSTQSDLYDDSFEVLSEHSMSIDKPIPTLLSQHDQITEKDHQLIDKLDNHDSSSDSLQLQAPVSRFHRERNTSSSLMTSSSKNSTIEEDIPTQNTSVSSKISEIEEDIPIQDVSVSSKISEIEEDIPMQDTSDTSTIKEKHYSKGKSSSTDEISEDIPMSSSSSNKKSKEESVIEEDFSFTSVKSQDSSNMIISPRYSSPKSEEDIRRISRYLEKEKYPSARDRSRSRSRSPNPRSSQSQNSSNSANQYYNNSDSFESYHPKDESQHSLEDIDLTSESSSLKSINNKIEQVKSKLFNDHLEKKEYRLSLSKEIAENLLKKRQKAIKWEEKLKREEKEIKEILDKALNMKARNSIDSSSSSSYNLSNDNNYLDSQYRMKEKEENKKRMTTATYVSSPLSKNAELGEEDNEMENMDNRKKNTLNNYIEDDEAEEIIEEEDFNHMGSSSLSSQKKYKSEEEIIEEMIVNSSNSNPSQKDDSIVEEIPDDSFDISNAQSKSISQSIEELIESKISSSQSKNSNVDDYSSNSFETIDTNPNLKIYSNITETKTSLTKSKLNEGNSNNNNKKKVYSDILENDLKSLSFSESALGNEDLDEEEKKLKERINLLKVQINQQKNVAKQLFLEKKKQRQLIHQKLLEKEKHFRQQLDRINAIVKKTENELNEIMRGGSVDTTPEVSLLQDHDPSEVEQLTEVSLSQDHTTDSKLGELLSIPSEENSASQYRYSESFESDHEDTSESLTKKEISIKKEPSSSIIEEDIVEDSSKSTTEKASNEKEVLPSEIKIEVTMADEEPQSEIELKIQVNKEKSDHEVVTEPKESIHSEISIEESIPSAIEEGIKEDIEEDIKEDIVEDIKEDVDEDIKKDIVEDIKEDIEEDVKDEVKKVIKENIEEDIKEDIEKEYSISAQKESIPSEISIEKEHSVEDISEQKESELPVEEKIEESIPSEISIEKELSVKDISEQKKSVQSEIPVEEKIEESISSEISEQKESVQSEISIEEKIEESIPSEISEQKESIPSEISIEKELTVKDISEQKESIQSEMPVEEKIEESLPTEIQIDEEILIEQSESSQSDAKSEELLKTEHDTVKDVPSEDIEMIDVNNETKTVPSEISEKLENNEEIQGYSDDFISESQIKQESQIEEEKESQVDEEMQGYSDDFINESQIKQESQIESQIEEKESQISKEISQVDEEEEEEEESETIKEKLIVKKEKEENEQEEVKEILKDESIQEEIIEESIEEDIEESIEESEKEKDSLELKEASEISNIESSKSQMSENVIVKDEDYGYSDTFIDEEQVKSSIHSSTVEKEKEEEEEEEKISEIIEEDIEDDIEEDIIESSIIEKEEENKEEDTEESSDQSITIKGVSIKKDVPVEKSDISEIKEISEKDKSIPQKEITEEIMDNKSEVISEEISEEITDNNKSEITSEEITKKEISSIPKDISGKDNDIDDALAILQEAANIIKEDWNTKDIQADKEEEIEHEKQVIISDITQQIFNDLLSDTMNMVEEITELKNNQQQLLNEELIAQPVDETTENDLEADIAVNDITDSMMEGLIEEILQDFEYKEKLDNELTSREKRLLKLENDKLENRFTSKHFEIINLENVNSIATAFLENIPEAEFIEPPLIPASKLSMFDEYPLEFDERMRIRIIFDMVNEAISDLFKPAQFANHPNNWLRTKQALPARPLKTSEIKTKVFDLLEQWTLNREKYNMESKPVLEVQLQEEEKSFVDYDDRNIQIQNTITEMIWDDLLEETVLWLNEMEEKK